MRSLKSLWVCLLVVCAAAAGAQTHSQDQSHHAGERLGTVNFPVSCADSVKARFTRGVALLHSFWYDEAERTFREVASEDPSCAMAWWGVAMSNYHPLWVPPTPAELARAQEAVDKAKALGGKTAREKAYIDAIAAFYKDPDKADHQTRARAYQAAMEEITRKFPADDEAKIFHGLTLIAHGMAQPTDKTYAKQKEAATILNGMLKKYPQHPGISHYIIHSFDYPALAHLGVDAAYAYAKIAPSSAHALHMPSHIFVRLGMWPETISSNLDSANAGKRNAKPGYDSWDALHAYDYLAYAYLQRGQDNKVDALIDEIQKVGKIDNDGFAAYYALAAIPTRNALEKKDWAAAAKLTPTPAELNWGNFPYAEALVYFGRAVGAARSGDAAAARKDLERMNALHDKLAEQKNSYWANQVAIQMKAAKGWIARAEGNNDKAMELLAKAAEMEEATDKHPVTPGSVIPAREMYADLLLELDRPGDALQAYERSLKDNPGRLNGLSGAARAAQLAGDRGKALDYYSKIAEMIDGGTDMRASAH